MRRWRSRAAFVLVLVAAALCATAGIALAEGVEVVKGAATPDQFQPSEQCGCHAQLIEQWLPTMHAKAMTDPLYLTKVEEADKATDGALGPFCKKCHGPIATMLGEVESGQLSKTGAEGVTCSFCHQVVALKDNKTENTSHLVQADGTRRAQIKDPKAPHPAAYSALHESAEICGGCHNVNHPINGMHLEATYSEWKASPWAKEGVVCQDCHMSEAPGTIGPATGQACAGGPERPNIYRMQFVGGNVAQGPPDVARARLQSAAEIVLDAPQIVAPGTTASATVTITNVGAGHFLPTGLTEVRQMWLEVYLEAPDGTKTPVGERRFGTILQDDKGNAPVELWEATSIKSDDRIPPRESVSEAYSVALPEGADTGELVAVLKYQSAPDDFAKKAGVDNPTTEMAKATQALYANEDAKLAAAREEIGQGDEGDTWNMVVLVLAVLAVAAIVVFFLRRSRESGGSGSE